jgi:cytochrome c556
MKSWIVVIAVALVPVAAATVGAFADDTPTIKAVMGKLHKGSKAQQKVLDTQVKAEKPDWDSIQKTTKDFVILGAALEKNDPPKGDKGSWKKFADKYYANAKALDDAAAAKDLDKIKATQKAIGGSCKACHTAHRPSQ